MRFYVELTFLWWILELLSHCEAILKPCERREHGFRRAQTNSLCYKDCLAVRVIYRPYHSLGRLAPFVERVFGNVTRAFAEMPSAMKREAYYRLCEVAWTLQQHPTQGRKLDRSFAILVGLNALSCSINC